MGFFINEPVSFGLYGITCENAYVTIKANYKHDKQIASVDGVLITTYGVIANYEVFVDKDPEIRPIQTGSVDVSESVPVVDVIGKIYAKIKLAFPGKTFTDDT
jgi:hypothetical protein